MPINLLDIDEADLDSALAESEPEHASTVVPSQPEDPTFSTGLKRGFEQNLTGIALSKGKTLDEPLGFEFGFNTPTAGYIIGQLGDPLAAVASLTGAGVAAKGASLLNAGKNIARGASLIGQTVAPAAVRGIVDPNATAGDLALEVGAGIGLSKLGKVLSKPAGKAATSIKETLAKPLKKLSGSGRLESATTKATDQLTDIAQGNIPSPADVGAMLTNKIAGHKEHLNTLIETSYDDIANNIPSIGLNNSSRIKLAAFGRRWTETAKGMLKNESTDVKSSASSIINELNDALRPVKQQGQGLKDFREQMKHIIDRTYDNKTSSRQLKEFRKELDGLYRESFLDSVNTKDSSLHTRLVNSNKAFSDFKKTSETASTLFDKTLDPKTKFNSVISSKDKATLTFIRDELLAGDPKAMGQFKAAFLKKMIPLNKDGEINVKAIQKVFRNTNNVDALNLLFDEKDLAPLIQASKEGISADRIKKIVQTLMYLGGATVIGQATIGGGLGGSFAAGRILE